MILLQFQSHFNPRLVVYKEHQENSMISEWINFNPRLVVYKADSVT